MCRSTVIALCFLPLAVAQEAVSSADRTASLPAVTPQTEGLVDKVLGIVGPAEPTVLTGKQRFVQYLLDTGGPLPILGEAAGAGISQWTNDPGEWGQGWGAYGKRFGSNLAYNGVRQTLTYATALAFHEDNRYFASHQKGVWRRTRYALASTVVAQHADGSRMFSVSSVAGVMGASAISSIWGPGSWKGAANIAGNAGFSFAATAGFNVVREFLPDLLHRR